MCMRQQGGERCRTKNLLCTRLCEYINLVSAACEGDMHFMGGVSAFCLVLASLASPHQLH